MATPPAIRPARSTPTRSPRRAEAGTPRTEMRRDQGRASPGRPRRRPGRHEQHRGGTRSQPACRDHGRAPSRGARDRR
jgi:hypothetical protein